MAIKIVTAKKGEEHVTSADAGALNQGTFGTDDYVLNVGEKFRAELVSNNEIKIYDGEGMMQGRHWRIEPGTYESVTIDNGSQGKKRKDLIVARYTKDSETGVENVELAVLKGSETEGNATAPEATKGDIRNGDLRHEMVLYTVTLDGLNVTAVDAEFSVLMTSVEEKEKLADYVKIVPVDLPGLTLTAFGSKNLTINAPQISGYKNLISIGVKGNGDVGLTSSTGSSWVYNATDRQRKWQSLTAYFLYIKI